MHNAARTGLVVRSTRHTSPRKMVILHFVNAKITLLRFLIVFAVSLLIGNGANKRDPVKTDIRLLLLLWLFFTFKPLPE
jgi:hypothetical protein